MVENIICCCDITWKDEGFLIIPESIFTIFVCQAAILIFTVGSVVKVRANLNAEVLYIDIFSRFQALTSANIA